MFGGGGGGMNPQKMQQMMEQMGVDMDELDAEEVVIRLEDGTELVFQDPEVTRMDARGQQTYSVVGEPDEERESEPEIEGADEDEGVSEVPQADVDIVAERTGASEADAREALEATDGDLAAAVELLE
ncbi:MAG: nascent polypeptide-associated complex protein [Halobacteriaceae archaeon]